MSRNCTFCGKELKESEYEEGLCEDRRSDE